MPAMPGAMTPSPPGLPLRTGVAPLGFERRDPAVRDAAGQRATADTGYRTLAAILFASLFLPRFVIKTGGSSEVPIVLPVMTLGLVYLLAIGRVRFSLPRLTLFLFASTCLTATAALGGSVRVSLNSLVLLLVLYAHFTIVLAPDGGVTSGRLLVLFQRFSTIIAVAGILQFLAQFAVPGSTLFTFQGVLPSAIVTDFYNYVIPLPSMPSLNKSNGFFLLEPSMLSQLMALAMVVELIYFNRMRRLGLFLVATLLSYSGTGLVVTLVFVPLLALRRGNPWLLIVGISAVLLLAFFSDALQLNSLTSRVGEFDSDRSSGFARFVSPWLLIEQFILPHVNTTLFGAGPGSLDAIAFGTNVVAFTAFNSTWGKILFEYGAVGALPFTWFILYTLFGRTASVILSAAVLVSYVLLSGYLLDARMVAEMLILVTIRGGEPPVFANELQQAA